MNRRGGGDEGTKGRKPLPSSCPLGLKYLFFAPFPPFNLSLLSLTKSRSGGWFQKVALPFFEVFFYGFFFSSFFMHIHIFLYLRHGFFIFFLLDRSHLSVFFSSLFKDSHQFLACKIFDRIWCQAINHCVKIELICGSRSNSNRLESYLNLLLINKYGRKNSRNFRIKLELFLDIGDTSAWMV